MGFVEKIPNEKIYIQAARIGIYVVALFMAFLVYLSQGQFLNWDVVRSFYIFVVIGLLIHVLPLFSLEKYFLWRKGMAASFIIDVVLITFLSLRTDLQQSLFLFMFLLTIILSGLVFGGRAALLISLLSSCGYTLSTLLGPEYKSLQYLFMVVLNNLSFFMVAWMSGYMAEQLNLLGQKLQAQTLSLRTIQKLNEAIVDTIPSGLLTTNMGGQILTHNVEAEKMFGRSDLVGRQLSDLLPAWKGLGSGESQELTILGDSPVAAAEPLLVRATRLAQKSDELVELTQLCILEDLTQIRKLEFAVRQSEKMAAIGQLAAGIAHEIRNPLAGISGSIELLSQQSQSEDDKKLTKIILREIDRLNNLISEFLDFAKPDQMVQDPIDLVKVIQECLPLVKMDARKDMSIELDLPPKAAVFGNRDKLKQAFLNILINAVQAMKDSANPKLSIVVSLREGKWQVSIKDSGVGMKEDVRKRIFEPFMTTKPKGTGLGLAITHKILESHKSQIFVESELGKGTEFFISFPPASH